MKRSVAIVIERDPVCRDCGSGENLEVHHIVPLSSFGKNRKALAWQPKNLIRLCADCHRLKDRQAGSHTHAARVRHLAMLAELFGYEYDEAPWSEYV